MGLTVHISMKQEQLTILNDHLLLGIPQFSEYIVLENFARYSYGKLYAFPRRYHLSHKMRKELNNS